MMGNQWPKLEEIYLGSNQIGEKGCEHLSKQNWWSVKLIYLGKTRIGAIGSEYLQEFSVSVKT